MTDIQAILVILILSYCAWMLTLINSTLKEIRDQSEVKFKIGQRMPLDKVKEITGLE